MNDTDTLLQFATTMAQDAGDIMRDLFFEHDKGTQIKADNSPVTKADTEINQLLIERVNAQFPECGVLGEEASDRQTNQRDVWVCDPIDGTAGFILGIPTAMFSLAFVRDGVPIIGVAYDPFLDRMYTAVVGKGAFCNGEQLHVDPVPFNKATVVGPSTLKDLDLTRELFTDIQNKGAQIALIAGGVYKGCLLASGRLHGRLFAGGGEHDIAAVKVIVEEAGGKVTDIEGNDQRYDQRINGAILSNGTIHDELVASVKQFGVARFMSMQR
ncbi:MAG: inositol monophosphatase family protein [Candidatus Saccharibacteria bacterium]